MNASAPANHLAGETSPYLLQHAHNPVDWYPWGDEALDRARREDKLILLSIGYSACHWCHVMAHESFEDPVVGALMNELFVCIKVDREERPDLDKIYQLAHQLMSRRAGGWPLTAFITPGEHTPLFVGTYFPPTPRHGMPSFTDVMRRIAHYYREHPERIPEHHQAVLQALAQTEPAPGAGAGPDEQPLLAAARQVAEHYDAVHGGFGGAPKFPNPTMLEFCLRQAWRERGGGSPQGRLHDIAMHTLRAMADGGFNDQLGGGFYRYTVDARWAIPHFEKMLYDNAQLLPLYADAAVITGDDGFAGVVHRTARWVMDEMQSPDGGYYSSLDADSGGGEGGYYLWDCAALEQLLTPAEWQVTQALHGLQGTPNFEGRWHLVRGASLTAAAAGCGMTPEVARAAWDSARDKLLAARRERVRPGLDDKVLSSWNALMIRGMAHAGGVLGCAPYLDSAARALAFLRRTAWRDGALLATSRNGVARLGAYLDDYVLLADALLECLQWRWNAAELAWAMELAEALLARFHDHDHGGFYFTAADHERLLHRHKPATDDALPCGNGVALRVLAKLFHITGDAACGKAVDAGLRALWSGIARHPLAHGSLLCALQGYLVPGRTIILRGAPGELEKWRRAACDGYRPFDTCLAIPNDAAGLPGLLAERKPSPGADGAPVAYVCKGLQCEAPLTSLEGLERTLRAE